MICKTIFLRKFVIKMNERDYYDFLRIANEDGLTVEEEIYKTISYYLKIERNKSKASKLFQ